MLNYRLTLSGLLLASTMIGLSGVHAIAQAPADVPRDHWAYPAVEDLASRGLIKGYPPEGRFFGKRTVTRYEMATIIQRVLARVDELLSKKADKGEQPVKGVPAEQLEELRKLVGEYKIELAVIGTDLQKVRDQIGELREQVDSAKSLASSAKASADKAGGDAAAARKEVSDFKGEFNKLKEAFSTRSGQLDSLTKSNNGHKLTGYIQARFESFDTGRTSAFTPTGAGGTGQTPGAGGPAVGGPYDGFLVRRARLKLSGPITSRTDYGIQIDAPSSNALNLKEAYVNIANAPSTNFHLTVGQFAPPFGYELPASSAVRESPERGIGFSETTASTPMFRSNQNATGGVVTPGSVLPLFLNQEYDQGLMLTYNAPNAIKPTSKFQLGLFNGEGAAAGGIRNLNNSLDVIGRASTTLLGGSLDLGISGYYGSLPVRAGAPVAGAVQPFINGLRLLGGADIRYYSPWGTTFRAEYVGGVQEAAPDRSAYLENNHVQAWYFTAKHPLSKKLDMAVKYDEYMPLARKGILVGGLSRMELIRKTLQAGLLYQMDEATRFRLWYARGLTPYDPAVAGPLHSRLGFLTGEVQVRY